MCCRKRLALRLEPLAVVIGLVFLRTPYRDSSIHHFLSLRTAGVTAACAASAGAASASGKQTHAQH